MLWIYCLDFIFLALQCCPSAYFNKPSLNSFWASQAAQRQCRVQKKLRFDLWVGRSPGDGNGNPLQYSCLENSMDRGVWGAQSMGSQRVFIDVAVFAVAVFQKRSQQRPDKERYYLYLPLIIYKHSIPIYDIHCKPVQVRPWFLSIIFLSWQVFVFCSVCNFKKRKRKLSSNQFSLQCPLIINKAIKQN